MKLFILTSERKKRGWEEKKNKSREAFCAVYVHRVNWMREEKRQKKIYSGKLHAYSRSLDARVTARDSSWTTLHCRLFSPRRRRRRRRERNSTVTTLRKSLKRKKDCNVVDVAMLLLQRQKSKERERESHNPAAKLKCPLSFSFFFFFISTLFLYPFFLDPYIHCCTFI